MNLLRNAQIININNNMYIKKILIKKQNNNHIMIIFQKQLIQLINLYVILFGFTMYVQFGFLNAIFNKKMD